MRCPCINEKPDPCPACGASVASGVCGIDLLHDKAYGLGMRAVLTAVWPHVSDSVFHPKDRRLAKMLTHLDAIADDRITAAHSS